MVRNEEGKKFAMKDLGLDTHVISSLKMAVENGDRKLLREVCKVIRVLCVNDDKREGVTPEIFLEPGDLASVVDRARKVYCRISRQW